MVDQLFGYIGRYRRTAPAAANIALAVNEPFANVIGSMYYNAPPHGIVVNAFFHSYQLQRIAVTAVVGIAGYVKTQTAFEGGWLIGEISGDYFTGFHTMGYPGII